MLFRSNIHERKERAARVDMGIVLAFELRSGAKKGKGVARERPKKTSTRGDGLIMNCRVANGCASEPNPRVSI